MLTDNPLQQSFNLNPDFNDFFNLDLPTTGTSRSSSNSPPGGSYLPLTPPQPPMNTDNDAFFSLYLADDFSKLDSFATAASSFPDPTFDFLGTLGAGSSSDSSGSVVESPSSVFAIDPQLMDRVDGHSPAKMSSEADDEEEDEDEDEDEEALVRPVKVGGKGKGRKGTVQTGGIVKKTGSAKDKKDKDKDNDDLDDWRPSPEEYKKMSSKEKRQLRNKISARNFRIRRKEYITTLEGDIVERDRLIDAIRSELTSTKTENSALRQEITALKKALLEGRESPILPPPSPFPSASVARPSSPLVTANTQKDLPSSPRMRAFWGGSQQFGGITPVHTTLMPDFPPAIASAALAGKGGIAKPPSPPLQENINPALNAVFPTLTSKFSEIPNVARFDSFTELNPFTLKNIDGYRMQLWGKLGAQNNVKAQSNYSQQPQQTPTGHAANMRPAYFTQPASTPALNKPAGSKALQSIANRSHNGYGNGPTAQQAMLASLASQTFVQRMSGAFWEAFSGAPSSSSRPGLDADKVRRVLEGKAVVRIVDIEPSTSTGPVGAVSSATAFGKKPVSPRMSAASVDNALEEKMRSLSLGAAGVEVKAKGMETAGATSLKECMSKRAVREGVREATGLYAAVAARK